MILVPLPDGRWIALEPKAFEVALAAGAAQMGTQRTAPYSPEPVLDAEELAKALNLPVTAIEERARRGEIPSIECGRWRRFKQSAVEVALAANGKGAA
jgi:excisionase family DNA binding protein